MSILHFFGSWICAFTRHRWKRNKRGEAKVCKRCGMVSPIKRRVTKG